eukprot:TRINITY_DN35359_c0_g1_i1.p1 TRINITY_DN35359_c0_g1~~TRINITY_DN35359_c0_g1_i1.p1  ORF type:complete len:172 (-),score=12.29 TRINITY_DN35359_c0_g1_i1:47-562(-)
MFRRISVVSSLRNGPLRSVSTTSSAPPLIYPTVSSSVDEVVAWISRLETIPAAQVDHIASAFRKFDVDGPALHMLSLHELRRFDILDLSTRVAIIRATTVYRDSAALVSSRGLRADLLSAMAAPMAAYLAVVWFTAALFVVFIFVGGSAFTPDASSSEGPVSKSGTSEGPR